jgi:hypothetical protein
MQEEFNANPQGESRAKERKLLIGLVFFFALINVLQFVFYLRSQQSLVSTQEVAAQQVTELQTAQTELDSLGTAIKVKIAEVQKLGGDTAALAAIGRELKSDLAAAKKLTKNDRKKILALRDKVEGYALLLNKKDEEIAQIKDERDKLFSANRKLKGSIVQQEDTIRALAETQSALKEKISLASILKIEDPKVSALDPRGTERDDDVLKAKRVEKLKIKFAIADNKVAQMGTKDVYLRLIDPDKSIITEAGASPATFTNSQGLDLAYTLRQSFIFDNQEPRLTFIVTKGGDYKPGTYNYEAWCEGYQIGTGTFLMR